jgi:DNA-binding transcriptional LysR family regulator
MQIKWIDDLLAVAQVKNFSRAAELRCVTQSALSRRIRSLEEWVGVELVDRGTYPVQLTRAGRTFCDQSREALDMLMELRSTLRSGDRMPGKSIQVVAGHSLSMTFLPKWLMHFQRLNGYFNARVVAANIHDAAIALSEGGCDLMIGYHHPQAPVLFDAERFVSMPLGVDVFIPVSAPDAQGAPLFALPGKASAPIPYLAYTATTFLGRVVDVILKAPQAPHFLNRCYEADMAMLLMKMAKEGYGITWLPESAVTDELARGELVRAGGVQWSAELEIRAYRSACNDNPTMQQLWKSLEQTSDAEQTYLRK